MDSLATELHAAREQALSGQYATAHVYMDNIISSIRGRPGNAGIVRELRQETKLMKQMAELVEVFRAQPGRKQVSDSIWSKGDAGYGGGRDEGAQGAFQGKREREKKDAMVWDPPTPPRKKDKHLPSWARKEEGPRSGGRASGGRDNGNHGGGPRPHFSRRGGGGGGGGSGGGGGGGGGGGAGGARRRQRPTAGGRSRDDRKRGGGGNRSRPGDDNKTKVKKGKRKLFVESDAASQLDAREIEMAEMIGRSLGYMASGGCQVK